MVLVYIQPFILKFLVKIFLHKIKGDCRQYIFFLVLSRISGCKKKFNVLGLHGIVLIAGLPFGTALGAILKLFTEQHCQLLPNWILK